MCHLSLWLARRLSDHRLFLRIVDPAVVPQVPQARRTSQRSPPPNWPTSTRTRRRSPAHPCRGSSCSAFPQTWAYAIPKFLTDPIWWFYLYWLPGYFSERFHLSLVGLGLPILIVYNASAIGSIYGGYLPASFIRIGLSAQARAPGGHASLRLPRGSRLSDQLPSRGQLRKMGRHRTAQPGGGRAPGLVGQPLHHRLGYVSAQRRRLGHRHRHHDRSGRRLPASPNCIGHILQITNSYSILFIIAASVYLVSLLINVLLAPGLKKVELTA